MTGLLALLNPYRWLMLAGLVAALTLGYFAWSNHQQGIGEQRATDRYNTAITKQKAEAAGKLATAVAATAAAEKALQDFKTAQERKDVQNRETVAELERRLRAAAPGGRLRDPNARGCRVGGGNAASPSPARASSGAGDAAEAGGLLSAQLTGLLQRITREADEVNTAYASCRAYIERVAPAR